MLDDGEAQAGPSQLTASSLVDSVESLEDSREILRRNASAGIGNLDHELPSVAPRHDADAASRTRVFDRIVNQISHNHADPLGIGEHRTRVLDKADRELDFFCLRLFPERIDRGSDGSPHVDRPDVESVILGFHPGKHQHVDHENMQTVRLFLNAFKESLDDSSLFDISIEQRFRVGLDRREGGLELVRDAGEEILTHAAPVASVPSHRGGR